MTKSIIFSTWIQGKFSIWFKKVFINEGKLPSIHYVEFIFKLPPTQQQKNAEAFVKYTGFEVASNKDKNNHRAKKCLQNL